jgi:hypothetical protein
MPQLKLLVTGFSPWRPGFNPGSGQVRFLVDKVVLGWVFSEYFVPIFIPPNSPS